MPGETGKAYWRTRNFNNIRVRMVEYTPGYLADHWCQKGHVLLVLDGELQTELADGRTVVLKQGQSYQVADGDSRPSFEHRKRRQTLHRGLTWTRQDRISSASAPWASRCAATSRARAARPCWRPTAIPSRSSGWPPTA